jgi:hypothetical protein
VDDRICLPQPSERKIEVFNAVLKLPATKRVAYLDEASTGEPALRRRLDALLQISESAAERLEKLLEKDR